MLHDSIPIFIVNIGRAINFCVSVFSKLQEINQGGPPQEQTLAEIGQISGDIDLDDVKTISTGEVSHNYIRLHYDYIIYDYDVILMM